MATLKHTKHERKWLQAAGNSSACSNALISLVLLFCNSNNIINFDEKSWNEGVKATDTWQVYSSVTLKTIYETCSNNAARTFIVTLNNTSNIVRNALNMG